MNLCQPVAGALLLLNLGAGIRQRLGRDLTVIECQGVAHAVYDQERPECGRSLFTLCARSTRPRPASEGLSAPAEAGPPALDRRRLVWLEAHQLLLRRRRALLPIWRLAAGASRGHRRWCGGSGGGGSPFLPVAPLPPPLAAPSTRR